MKTLTGFEKYSTAHNIMNYYDDNKMLIGFFQYGSFCCEVFFLFNSSRLYMEVLYVDVECEFPTITICRAYADNMTSDWVVYS